MSKIIPTKLNWRQVAGVKATPPEPPVGQGEEQLLEHNVGVAQPFDKELHARGDVGNKTALDHLREGLAPLERLAKEPTTAERLVGESEATDSSKADALAEMGKGAAEVIFSNDFEP